MSRRWALLHVRATGLPTLTAGVSVVSAVSWWLVQIRPDTASSAVAFAPLLATVFVSPTLAGADEALERATPFRWPWSRLLHIGVTAAMIGLAMAVAVLPVEVSTQDQWTPTMLRNVLGDIGLILAAAVFVGARLAWLPTVAYVCAVFAAPPLPVDAAARVWAWFVQRSTEDISWWTAVTLFVSGTAVFMLYGSARPVSGNTAT